MMNQIKIEKIIQDNMSKEYDYIVVGSGPGGCAVASVLTSNRKLNVLMIEAGEDKDEEVPIYDSQYALSLEDTYYNQYFWIAQQLPQTNVNMPTANYTNGRLYGGGSSINGEQYVRGSPYVFDNWYGITGDTDWSSYSVYDTYIEFENLIAVTPGPSQGYDGPVSIRQAPVVATAAGTKFVQAVSATNLNPNVTPPVTVPTINDYNSHDTPYGAFTRWQYYQKENGNRESSSTAI